MKKIILILFLFFSFLTCYLVYNLTTNEEVYYLAIGDTLADNPYLKNNQDITNYNNYYVNKDYRIIDILNIIKYNQELTINDKPISIHQLLKKSDIVILSIGMNDIYYKLNDNTKDIYTYINNMVNNLELILDEINRYNHQQVIILGYYNITNQNNDIFTYLNYKMERITEKYHFTYLELNDIFRNNPIYLENNHKYYLNNAGYEEINKLIVENFKKT